jgi:hypothetical protein
MRHAQQVYPYPPLDRGQNDTASPSGLQPGELAHCRNFHANERGELYVRSGQVKWNSGDTAGATAGSGLWEVRTLDGDIYQIKFVGSKIYLLQSGAWEEITGTATITETGANAIWSVCSHYGKVYAVNGGRPIKWDLSLDGFTDFLGTGVPEAAGCVWSAFGRLWFGDITENGVRIPCYVKHSFSLGADPTFSLDVSYTYAFSPDYGSRVVGAVENDGILYGFCYPKGLVKLSLTSKTAPFFDQNQFTLQTGCASGQTIWLYGTYLLFLGDDGEIKAWDTESSSAKTGLLSLTGSLQGTMLSAVYRLRNRYASATYVEEQRQYWLLVTEDEDRTATQHNIVVALRLPKTLRYLGMDSTGEGLDVAPFIYEWGHKINYLSCWENAAGEKRPVGIGYDGIVYDLWGGAGDDGLDLDCEARLPVNHYGYDGIKKRFFFVGQDLLQCEDGEATVKVQHFVDGNTPAGMTEYIVRQAGVPIGHFVIGRHAIGGRGKQDETMDATGLGVRSQIRYRIVGKSRVGITNVRVGYRFLRTPDITK